MPSKPQDLPRAIRHSSIRAQGGGNPAAVIAQLTEAFDTFRSSHDDRLRAVEENQDSLATRLAVSALGAPTTMNAEDAEYSRNFSSFFRSGENEGLIRAANGSGQRAKIQAAMSSGSNPDGGYLTPIEWDRKINKALVAVSPMRRLATVLPTTVGAYSTIWNTNAWGSGWVGETAARAATSTTSLAPVTFAAGEIYANPFITQRLLDDADFDIVGWLASEVETEFSRQEGIAFVGGDGVNKPAGFLTYAPGGTNSATHPGGALDAVPSGVAAGIASDALVDFFYGLAAPYRQNASWLMSSTTAASVAKLKDGQGNYLWRDSFLADQPATLLGRPVAFDENMPAVAAGNLSIAYGDFARGYLINDRYGIRTLRDPYTNKPYVGFYVTKRVGGGVSDPRAIRVLKIAAS